MKFIIVFVALFAIVMANSDKEAQILLQKTDVQPHSYQFAEETSNGIKAEESGQVVNIGTDQEALKVQGQYSYVGDDGQTYAVSYIADENGFQPQGAHIPSA